MRALISKSAINGNIIAPSSKSYTIRSLICSALASGKSEIINPLFSEDTVAAYELLSQMGIKINKLSDRWILEGDNFHRQNIELFCGDSAATLRFMAAISSAIPGSFKLTAGQSLSRRPVQSLVDALQQLGVKCSSNNGRPPVIIEGDTLQGGITRLPGDISSQYVSALLLAAPLAKEKVGITLTIAPESIPYILMTLECQIKFGVHVYTTDDFCEFEIFPQTYTPISYKVEGDWSSASYFFALGATSGEVKIANLNLNSLQGDKIILELLQQMGATVTIDADNIIVKKSSLRGIKADLSNCIDLLPTMAVLASIAKGNSTFTGIKRARLKESNRVSSLKEGLEKMNIPVIEEADKLTITGSKPESAIIDPKSDHRIAMAFSVLGTIVGDTVVENSECVNKTFPDFWGILKNIGGKVDINEQ
jgi:3-phosphoshikimate 1-carboxyvinyltransferase